MLQCSCDSCQFLVLFARYSESMQLVKVNFNAVSLFCCEWEFFLPISSLNILLLFNLKITDLHLPFVLSLICKPSAFHLQCCGNRESYILPSFLGKTSIINQNHRRSEAKAIKISPSVWPSTPHEKLRFSLLTNIKQALILHSSFSGGTVVKNLPPNVADVRDSG